MSSVSRRSRLAVSCVPESVTASRQGLGPAIASAPPLELELCPVPVEQSCACGSSQHNCFGYKIMYFVGLGTQLHALPASDVFCGMLFPSRALVLN